MLCVRVFLRYRNRRSGRGGRVRVVVLRGAALDYSSSSNANKLAFGCEPPLAGCFLPLALPFVALACGCGRLLRFSSADLFTVPPRSVSNL